MHDEARFYVNEALKFSRVMSFGPVAVHEWMNRGVIFERSPLAYCLPAKGGHGRFSKIALDPPPPEPSSSLSPNANLALNAIE